MNGILDVLRSNQMTVWIFSISAVMFFGSIGLAWLFIVKLPTDYLTSSEKNSSALRARHPIVAATLLVARNLFGFLLVVSGVIMLFVPGQGILFIFLGTTLMDIPGKKRVIRQMLTWRNTLSIINRIREKAHAPPLENPVELTTREHEEPSP